MANADSKGVRAHTPLPAGGSGINHSGAEAPSRSEGAEYRVRKGSRWTMEAQLSARMPRLDIPAAKQFTEEWASLPLHHKVLHALAHGAGLKVTHTTAQPFPDPDGASLEGWQWIGSEDCFRAAGLLKQTVNYGFERWARTYTGEGLRLCLARGVEGIYALHDGAGVYGKRSCARFVAMAVHDSSWRSVRATILQPVPGLDLPSDLYDWSGPVRIEIPAFVRGQYQRYAWGTFQGLLAALPESGVICVNVALAKAIHADAVQRSEWGGQPDSVANWKRYVATVVRALAAHREGGRGD